MLSLLQVLVFVAGVAALFICIRFMIFFRRSKNTLSWAMQAFLIEQIVSTLGTLIFASNSLIASVLEAPPSDWNSLGPEVSTTIRLLIFGAMLHSTVYLSYEIKKILKYDDSSEVEGD